MGLFSQKTYGAGIRDGGGPRGAHTIRRRGGPLGRAALWWRRLSQPPTLPFGLLKAPDLKTHGGSTNFPEDIQNSAVVVKLNLGIRNSILAPCRDGELEEIIAIITTDASPSTIYVFPIHV